MRHPAVLRMSIIITCSREKRESCRGMWPAPRWLSSCPSSLVFFYSGFICRRTAARDTILILFGDSRSALPALVYLDCNYLPLFLSFLDWMDALERSGSREVVLYYVAELFLCGSRCSDVWSGCYWSLLHEPPEVSPNHAFNITEEDTLLFL